jgi:hypothetical protein
MPLSVPKWSQDVWRNAFVDYVKAQKVTDRELVAILRNAAHQARGISATLDGIDKVGAQVRKAQMDQSVAELTRISDEMWAGIDSNVKSGLTTASDAAIDGQAAMLDVLGRSITNQMLLDSMQTAARQAAENVRSRVVNKIPISRDVTRNKKWAISKMQEEINNGIALNKSAKEIAGAVVDLINPDTPGGASFAAMRIGRTELNNAFHTTTTKAVADKPWVDGVKWNLSGSHPRPDECNDYSSMDHAGLGDGIFTSDKVPGKPHPNCLCFTTVITVDPDQFSKNLLSGRYDRFLVSHGMAPIAG